MLETVLVVDDDDDVRTIVEISLGEVGGLEVVSARSGAEGIATAAAARPDVILLDVMMPGLDGLGTLDRLRSAPALCDIPVIMMTANVREDDRSEYIARGALAVIAKPFDPMSLADQVRALVDGATATS